MSSQFSLDDGGGFAALGIEHQADTRVVDRDDVELCKLVRGSRPDSLAARQAYGELYARHQSVAMAQAYRLTEDRSRAEDLVSEAFSKTLRALQSGRGPDRSFLGYVMITLRTENLKSLTAPDHIVPTPIEDVVDDALTSPDPATGISESDQLARAFKGLPETWQRVLWLLEIEELPIEQAAEHLEITTPALRSLSYRAREGLRAAYLQQYAETSAASCGEVPSLLAAFTRENLRPRQQLQVTEHLAGCADCTAQTTRLSRLNNQLRAWAGPMILAAGGGAAVTGLSSDQATAAALPSSSNSMTARVLLALGVVAVVGLSVTGITLLLPGQDATPATPPISKVSEGPEAPVAEEAEESTKLKSRSGVPLSTGVTPGQDTTQESPTSPQSQDIQEPQDPASPVPAPEDPIWEDDATPNWKLR